MTVSTHCRSLQHFGEMLHRPDSSGEAGIMPAVTDTEAPRSHRLSKEARRSQLLDTAGELLLRDGVDALTMEGIGQGAGASKTLGYAYFDNVDHVIVALRERELGRLYERVKGAAVEVVGLEAKVAAAFGAYFDICVERGLLLGDLEQAARGD